MTRSPTIGIRFTPEDLFLLDVLAAKEERNRSDVVRRAVRAYAEQLGVALKPKRKAKPKPQK
jgi:metal-responsive CopG/Arc/MetJ family transcriptional regulator